MKAALVFVVVSAIAVVTFGAPRVPTANLAIDWDRVELLVGKLGKNFNDFFVSVIKVVSDTDTGVGREIENVASNTDLEIQATFAYMLSDIKDQTLTAEQFYFYLEEIEDKFTDFGIKIDPLFEQLPGNAAESIMILVRALHEDSEDIVLELYDIFDFEVTKDIKRLKLFKLIG